jgi:hypothetical protein
MRSLFPGATPLFGLAVVVAFGGLVVVVELLEVVDVDDPVDEAVPERDVVVWPEVVRVAGFIGRGPVVLPGPEVSGTGVPSMTRPLGPRVTM